MSRQVRDVRQAQLLQFAQSNFDESFQKGGVNLPIEGHGECLLVQAIRNKFGGVRIEGVRADGANGDVVFCNREAKDVSLVVSKHRLVPSNNQF